MATKRTSARKTSPKSKPRAELKKLLAKAQAEVANLLKKQRAGTLAQVELKARLEEIKGQLEAMEPFDWHTRH
jgi:chromosome segregation ATPase